MGEQRITFTAAISNGTAKTALDKSLGGLGAEVSDKWLGEHRQRRRLLSHIRTASNML
ncbi:hypothetical protein FIV06_30020 (plasmid) [Labrenzia sp. THAF191b]|nr:hypothetical protein FIV06_30020 [Labrenzia sp. THAF191b]QFT07912.1 hypothetical protein FIV05_29470 [Labrenzia sp. THAF191a]QFT19222.1 hypothetical protein FIV03_28315 [Labrenzia sp. THAF187b]